MVGLFGRTPKDPQQKRNAEKIKEFKKLIKAQQYDRALKLGVSYLSDVPNNHDILFSVGGIYYLKKRYRTAISYFDRALKIGSYDVEVLLLKAYSHQKLNEKAAAIKCCKKIQEVDPKNKNASRMLSEMT